MARRKKKKGKVWVTLAECAERLALTPRQIENLVTLGLPRDKRETGRWGYPFPDVLEWYVAHKMEAAGIKRESDSQREAQERLADVKAQLAELELAKAQGEVVTMEYLEEQLGRIVHRLAARCRNLPGKWAPDLVGLRTIPEAQVQLEKISAELLSSLSEAGDDPELDDNPDPEPVSHHGAGHAHVEKKAQRDRSRRARTAA